MDEINEKMDQALMDDDFNQIENIALNKNHAYVKVTDINLFTGKSRTTHRSSLFTILNVLFGYCLPFIKLNL
jgi:hypothetical protein